MKKRFTALFLVILISFSQINVCADTVLSKAETLYTLGLLKGNTDTFSEEGLQLERNATRAEICTTIVRMLGKEEKAHYQQNAHPFTDVPAWANDYVGWLYENYLVNGISDTYFGAQDIATVKQFSTMLLRVLGFSDAKGDFNYDSSVEFSQNYGLLDTETATHYELSRKDMVLMCYNALRLNIKNSNRKLINKLCDEGSVNEQLALSSGILKEASISDSFPDVPENLGEISILVSGSTFVINMHTPVEEYGIRVYVKEENGVLKEIGKSGAVSFRKGQIQYLGGGAAGYIDTIYVNGLNTASKYSFIVIKTTSEGALYHKTGKSAVAHNF